MVYKSNICHIVFLLTDGSSTQRTNQIKQNALGALILCTRTSTFFLQLWMTILENGNFYVKQTELKTAKKVSKKAAEAAEKAEQEASVTAGGCSNKTIKYDNLVNPKTLKAFDKKNVSLRGHCRFPPLPTHPFPRFVVLLIIIKQLYPKTKIFHFIFIPHLTTHPKSARKFCFLLETVREIYLFSTSPVQVL